MGVLIAPLVYVLSVGPVAKLNKLGIVPNSSAFLYKPLRMLVDRYPPADRFFTWYIGTLWRCESH